MLFYFALIRRKKLDTKLIIIVIFLNFIDGRCEFIRFPKNEPIMRIGKNNRLNFIDSSVNNPKKKYPIRAMEAETILNHENTSRNC